MANITNSRNNTIISGKSGNDVIGNYGSKVTINGGAGNDAIGVMSNKKHVFQCDYGNGNDWIYGFNSNDTLQINAYSYSTLVSGNDFIVFVGTGSFTLKNSANITYENNDVLPYEYICWESTMLDVEPVKPEVELDKIGRAHV